MYLFIAFKFIIWLTLSAFKIPTIVRWSFVSSHAGPVWRSAGVCPWTSALRHVHCRSQQSRHAAWSSITPVRWRLSSLSFINCQRRINIGRPIRSLYWRPGCLAECQPVTFESYQDSSLMAGLEVFSGQDYCPSRAGPVFSSPDRRLGPRPRCRDRQPPDYGWPRHLGPVDHKNSNESAIDEMGQ